MNLAQIMEIPMAKLYVGKSNVRSVAGDITELTKSIEEEGVLQPILVRPVKERYEIIVGSRRFSAAKAAGLKSIPAVIREMDDGEAIVASLSENIQRGDLQPEEEAKAIEKLVGIYRSNREVARVLGLSEGTIRMKLSILELVPKLRSKMRIKYAPSPKEREKEGALPFEHATMIAEAFRTEEIKRLPKEEREEKQVSIARAIAPLPQYEARRVVDRFKMFPEKSIEVIKEEALATETGVAVRVYFIPKVARLLSKAAEDRGMSMEELVPIAVEEWLKQVGYRGGVD
jgi:ParB family chromosome partitioning protein